MSQIRLEVQQSQKLSQSMQTAVHLLSLDLDGLSDYMLRTIQENPALEYVPAKKSPTDYAMQVKTRYSGAGKGTGTRPEAADPSTGTVLEDLELQLRYSGLEEKVCRTAIQMLHLLSSRGYFTQDLDAFATESGVSQETVRQALEAVQSLEPAGIGARNVEECLELQLRRKTSVDPLCYELIRMYLLEIGKGNIRQIARETGATLQHVQQCIEEIKTLTPAPCSLSNDAVQYIMPEFSVEAGANNQLILQFHNDYYPTFRQDENFRRLSETLAPEEQAYARKMLTTATQLIHAIEMRQTTMEKVAQIIVREQRPFFLGQYSLLPLRIEDAAKEIGVHEATVYRAIQNKYLYCSRGTFPLNHFFQKELSGGSSQARVKEIIQELCEQNDRMSDREIAEALEKRGVQLSRRTVAKYRSQLDIHSSFRREAKGGQLS